MNSLTYYDNKYMMYRKATCAERLFFGISGRFLRIFPQKWAIFALKFRWPDDLTGPAGVGRNWLVIEYPSGRTIAVQTSDILSSGWLTDVVLVTDQGRSDTAYSRTRDLPWQTRCGVRDSA